MHKIGKHPSWRWFRAFFVSWRLKPVPGEIHNGKGRGMTMKDIPRNSEETNWKRELSEILNKLGFVDEKFVGRIVININQGGITDVEKVQRMK